ncbi:unnamed protein product [Owenia fusiformis]|uniref:Uncharacterized protein n=1 Tax=Owenia fusiformis TaxID=6347 RepID=A0A8J1XQ70_OWEFU|nr:unnamed protein product [Owenia fusiformis]
MALLQMNILIGSLMLLSSYLAVVHGLQCFSCTTIDNEAPCGDAKFDLTVVVGNTTCNAASNCCEGRYCTKSKGLSLGITTITRGCANAGPSDTAIATPSCKNTKASSSGVEIESWRCSCTGSDYCNSGTTMTPSIVIFIIATLII